MCKILPEICVSFWISVRESGLVKGWKLKSHQHADHQWLKTNSINNFFLHQLCSAAIIAPTFFWDAIASSSTYPCQSMSESFIVSDLEIATASLSFASLFVRCCFLHEFGHQLAPLTLVTNLVPSWCDLHFHISLDCPIGILISHTSEVLTSSFSEWVECVTSGPIDHRNKNNDK